MTALARKLSALEKDLSSKWGPFALFGLFLREDSPSKWDLVIAAPWTSTAKERALQGISRAVNTQVSKKDLLSLSRIILLDPSDPPVRAINRAFQVEHGNTEVRDSSFFGMPIRHAWIITSKAGAGGPGTT